MTSRAGVGPGDASVPGESVYNLASASDTTGVTYVLPAPTGRYAPSFFKCEVISASTCGDEGQPPCPQICDFNLFKDRLLFNLSGARRVSNMFPRSQLLL